MAGTLHSLDLSCCAWRRRLRFVPLGAQAGADILSATVEALVSKLNGLIGWERRKQREQVFLALLCCSWALAILLFPLHRYFDGSPLRWFAPLILSVMLAPYFLLRRRWRREDSTRAVLRLDKTLQLDERAVTAWELSAQVEPGKAGQFVLKQAEEKLRFVEPRTLLPRRWNWTAYLVAPIILLWFALLWFDVDRWFFFSGRPSSPQTLAHRLREYSRELQDRAKNEGLRESLKMAQELENVAQKNIGNKTHDEQVKKDVAGVAKKFDAAAKSGAGKDSFSAAESQQSLRDLKAELEAARDMMELPAAAKGTQDLTAQWMERLAGLPQLKRQMENDPRAGQGMSQSDLKSFLDRLNNQVTGELDRRALLDAQQYLEQMMKQGQSRGEGSNQRSSGRGEEELGDDGAREKNPGSLPGKEPGKTDEGYRSLPEFRAGPSTHVKGALGEGESSGVVFKGKPLPGKSGLSPAEVVASYRRQAEQELNSERVPEALKETIKNYFLSLGNETK